MKNTKSYRFCEQTQAYLDFLTRNTGCNERQIIEAAIQKLFTETENITPNISIDFKDNLFGINNNQVQKFIESLPKAGYEIVYYGNYDSLVIQKRSKHAYIKKINKRKWHKSTNTRMETNGNKSNFFSCNINNNRFIRKK